MVPPYKTHRYVFVIAAQTTGNFIKTQTILLELDCVKVPLRLGNEHNCFLVVRAFVNKVSIGKKICREVVDI